MSSSSFERYSSFSSHLLTGKAFINRSNLILSSLKSQNSEHIRASIHTSRSIVAQLNNNLILPRPALALLDRQAIACMELSKTEKQLCLSWILHARALALHIDSKPQHVISCLKHALDNDSQLYIHSQYRIFLDSHYMLVARLLNQSLISKDFTTLTQALRFIHSNLYPHHQLNLPSSEHNLFASRLPTYLPFSRRRSWLLALATNQLIMSVILSEDVRSSVSKYLTNNPDLMLIPHLSPLSRFLQLRPPSSRILAIDHSFPYNTWLLNFLSIDNHNKVVSRSMHLQMFKTLCQHQYPSYFLSKTLLKFFQQTLVHS